MLLAVHYRVIEHVGSLESTQVARDALGYHLGELLRFFRALQTSRVLHNMTWHRLYYDSSIRGYSVVIYNTKIICFKKFIKVRIYTCVANKNIYMGNTVLKRLYKINYEIFFKKWAAAFFLKLKILLVARIYSGSKLYSFAPRKAKERWPVDNLHLGRFNCDLFLVLRPDTLNLSWNKLHR